MEAASRDTGCIGSRGFIKVGKELAPPTVCLPALETPHNFRSSRPRHPFSFPINMLTLFAGTVV